MAKNDRKVSNITRCCLILWNVGLFAYIWVSYYNNFAFRSHRIQGAIACIALFFMLYMWLCSVYRAFRIASTPLFDIVFAHMVSFCLSDLNLYFVACLSGRHPLNILYGAAIVVLQLAGTIFICVASKRKLMKVIVPHDTLIISGQMRSSENVSSFIDRLKFKYDFLYDITERILETEPYDELFAAIDRHDTVILFEVEPNKRRLLIKACTERHKAFLYDPRIEDIICEGCSGRHYLDTPLMRYDFHYKDFYAQVMKRILDVVLSLVLIVILTPFMCIVMLAIKAEDHGPVFYRQKRVTKNGKVFEMIKFRSMVVDAEKMGVIPSTENDPRITKVGKFIRATRMDELPQLFNILHGDMSFVGPRPERVEHVEYYTKLMPEFQYRHRVKGGLTGYAQVYGKYNTSAYDKLRLDLEYIENQSFLSDLKIFLLTIRTVFQREATEGFDANQSNQITHSVNAEMSELNE